MAVAIKERVTITLPAGLVRDIDRLEKNRSKFLEEAAQHELERRRRASLERSLRSPHAEGEALEAAGFAAWAASLPDEDAAGLVDMRAGTEVRWAPGAGWTAPAT